MPQKIAFANHPTVGEGCFTGVHTFNNCKYLNNYCVCVYTYSGRVDSYIKYLGVHF